MRVTPIPSSLSVSSSIPCGKTSNPRSEIEVGVYNDMVNYGIKTIIYIGIAERTDIKYGN